MITGVYLVVSGEFTNNFRFYDVGLLLAASHLGYLPALESFLIYDPDKDRQERQDKRVFYEVDSDIDQDLKIKRKKKEKRKEPIVKPEPIDDEPVLLQQPPEPQSSGVTKTMRTDSLVTAPPLNASHSLESARSSPIQDAQPNEGQSMIPQNVGSSMISKQASSLDPDDGFGAIPKEEISHRLNLYEKASNSTLETLTANMLSMAPKKNHSFYTLAEDLTILNATENFRFTQGPNKRIFFTLLGESLGRTYQSISSRYNKVLAGNEKITRALGRHKKVEPYSLDRFFLEYDRELRIQDSAGKPANGSSPTPLDNKTPQVSIGKEGSSAQVAPSIQDTSADVIEIKTTQRSDLPTHDHFTMEEDVKLLKLVLTHPEEDREKESIYEVLNRNSDFPRDPKVWKKRFKSGFKDTYETWASGRLRASVPQPILKVFETTNIERFPNPKPNLQYDSFLTTKRASTSPMIFRAHSVDEIASSESQGSDLSESDNDEDSDIAEGHPFDAVRFPPSISSFQNRVVTALGGI